MQKVNKANSSTNIFWKFFLFSVMAAKVNFNDGIITTELLNHKKKKKKSMNIMINTKQGHLQISLLILSKFNQIN